MAPKYKEYSQLNMPAIEAELLRQWKDHRVFEQSVASRAGNPPFVFYEGPPSANGMPGIHHVISRTLKDLVCRYKTMQGFQVKRKAGWDTHGLPVELGVEKELGITKEDIGKKISVADYNQKCREAVMRYKSQWDELTQKMGYWVDLDDPYITFDNRYIETLWWALKELFKKDLLYKSVSIQPFSPAAGTGLSSHELNQPGTYKDVKDTTAVVMFKVRQGPHFKVQASDELYFLAWTTTPWTLPSNTGLTVGPSIDYEAIKTFNPYTGSPCTVILATPLLHQFFPKSGNEWQQHENPALAEAITNWFERDIAANTIGADQDLKAAFDRLVKKKQLPFQSIARFKGKDLEGVRYEQILSFENNRPELSGGDPFRVVLGDFVTTEDGTGIVHTAPAFGADDFKVGQKNNLGSFTLVDRQGRFIEGSGPFSGRYVKNYKDDPAFEDVDVDIAVRLKQAGRAFRVEKYEHSYPHCWRTDKPIIYYPLDAWFIRTTALKERMIALNNTINWKPKATGEGRFGNWLENMVDWNLSRSRFWGTPLPVWISEDGRERKCIGSIAELKSEVCQAIDAGIMPSDTDVEKLTQDLHRPYVDEIRLVSDSGQPMRREPDLIDVWFDSGAMPYAQWHFPFENKTTFAQNYPADFIAEGVDQTRGWFYTLHALGALLQESVQDELKEAGIPADDNRYPGLAYKTVVSNGLVLDKNGNKMSKRVGNVVDPFETIERYSADATRWYLMTNAAPWDSLRFDLKGIEEVQRKFFGTLYNTYQFFALYANVDGFTFSESYLPPEERPEMDQWILSALNSLIAEVRQYMDDYEPTQAGRAIEQFLDESLSNWYVRLCRRRFWKGAYEQDKIAAYQTLYECLEKLALLAAPVAPFFADWLFRNLNSVTGRSPESSVHLASFPQVSTPVIQKDLEERMRLAQTVSSLVLSLRKKVNIKVRQPLQQLLIPIVDSRVKQQIEKVKEVILAEVNVKEIAYLEGNDGFIKKKIKPEFKVLGKKAGKLMKAATAQIAAFTQDQIQQLESGTPIILRIDGTELSIMPEDVQITAEDIPGWSVAHKDGITVALDVTLTQALQEEGDARELVNRIQKIRKESGLELTDRIRVQMADCNAINGAIINYKEYIRSEILADSIEMTDDEVQNGAEVDVNGSIIKVFISKNA